MYWSPYVLSTYPPWSCNHRYNPELLDPWENHVAVMTRGWRDVLSPNHTYELGHSTTYDTRIDACQQQLACDSLVLVTALFLMITPGIVCVHPALFRI